MMGGDEHDDGVARRGHEFVNAGALVNAHQGALRLVQAVLVVIYLVLCWVVWVVVVIVIQVKEDTSVFLAGAVRRR